MSAAFNLAILASDTQVRVRTHLIRDVAMKKPVREVSECTMWEKRDAPDEVVVCVGVVETKSKGCSGSIPQEQSLVFKVKRDLLELRCLREKQRGTGDVAVLKPGCEVEALEIGKER